MRRVRVAGLERALHADELVAEGLEPELVHLVHDDEQQLVVLRAIGPGGALDLEREQFGHLEVGRVGDGSAGHPAMVRPGRRSVLGADADDEHRRLVVADDLAVVRDRAVPPDVVAGADLDDVVALGQPEPAAQDDVMLVAGMGVRARRADPAGPTTSRIETSRESARRRARPGRRPSRSPAAPWPGRRPGAGTSSMRNQAVGTSSASAMDARHASDGDALSFSICER